MYDLNPVFIPGPTNIPDRVRNAMHVQTRDHRAPDFGTIGFDADALVATLDVGDDLAPRRVLTPHEGEASRLLGDDAGLDRLDAVRRLSRRGTALLKGPHTLVADRSQGLFPRAMGSG